MKEGNFYHKYRKLSQARREMELKNKSKRLNRVRYIPFFKFGNFLSKAKIPKRHTMLNKILNPWI